MVIERTSGVSGLPIVQNWDSVNHPFDSYTVPRDGWAGVIVHAENKKTNDITKHESTAINVSLNGIALGGAEASGTPTNHIESTNSYFLPVKAGDVFSWGGASTTAPPNGYFNTLRIRLFSYAGT